MIAALALLAGCAPPEPTPPPAPTAEVTERVDHQAELPPSSPSDRATFTPPARGDYPEGDFGEAVRRGEAMFRSTPDVIGEHMGNALSCSNCHLDDGRRADSAPMWAAWVQYPAYRKKNDHVNSMEERLRGCFTYSLNAQDSARGGPPETGDPRLTDLEAYLYWLSTSASVGVTMPGRGYPTLDAPPQAPDAARGATIYASQCETCHGADGQGESAEGAVVFPPLWGPQSYNWGAGMHRVNTSAGFIWANMPLGQPRTLSEQEAWDVAAYINSQPRPSDPRATTLAETDARFHSHDCRYGDDVGGHTLGEGSKR